MESSELPQEHAVASPLSSVSVVSSSPSYPYRRRFEHQTRRAALLKRFGTDEKKEDGVAQSPLRRLRQRPSSPPFADDAADRECSTDRITLETENQITNERRTSLSYTSLSDMLQSQVITSPEDHHETLPIPRRPQHEQNQYYRIVYRGVVALLAEPNIQAAKSGSYLSYGDIVSAKPIPSIQSPTYQPAQPNPNPRNQIQVKGDLPPSLPYFSKDNRDDTTFLRVDFVLTGGYAVDSADDASSGPDSCVLDAKTPKRSNQCLAPAQGYHSLGYLMPHLAEPTGKPSIETGRFRYKIMSSTPITVLTGPSLDAPSTQAMVLPGTVHEVSVRLLEDGIGFLRLAYRRGWIADSKRIKGKIVSVVKELTDVDDGTMSVVSGNSLCSSATSGTTRSKHRPPRRLLREGRSNAYSSFPRHVLKSTPVRGKAHEAAVLTTTPTSTNMSLLSDDESTEHDHVVNSRSVLDISFAPSGTRSTVSSSFHSTPAIFYLMRVTAPRGLKILDAPQFQVNNLIRKQNVASSHLVSETETKQPKVHPSIFQTMSGRLTSTGPSKTGNPAVFDSSSKTRVLPFGVHFEASRRMESSGAYSQSAGLIKLSDNSGWAIVPLQEELEHQHRMSHGDRKDEHSLRAFEEVGNAILDELQPSEYSLHGQSNLIWLRVSTREGLHVICPPPPLPVVSHPNETDTDTSPTSSRSSSAVTGSNIVSNIGPLLSKDSDVASSVGSGFLDAMFRTPKKKLDGSGKDSVSHRTIAASENKSPSYVISCGMIVQVERWTEPDEENCINDFVRLRGGQGWIPLSIAGKPVVTQVSRPEFRRGSFWFRVQSSRGIKVRLGPSERAPSIKSDEGAHFRFECGEFLRASEIMTAFSDAGTPVGCYAKLYRNRHVQLDQADDGFRQLASLTCQAEWVQIYNSKELFLEECAIEPRIERHKQGWRYNVVPDSGVAIRRGPSFASEKTGTILFGGESIVINERVTPAGDKITWLRLKGGQGWVYDVTDTGEQIMIAHSLRHRPNVLSRPQKPPAPKEEIAYNTIIARLFHSDGPDDSPRTPIRSRDV